jgi:hypothetical protein
MIPKCNITPSVWYIRFSRRRVWRWDPCGILRRLVYRCFRDSYCLHHQDDDDSSLWWWMQYEPLKRRSTSTRLHGAISQKAVIFLTPSMFWFLGKNTGWSAVLTLVVSLRSVNGFFPPKGGVGLVPKRGCLLYVSILRILQMIWVRERRWNDIDRGKPKNSEKNLSQCHFGQHKSHMDWPGREPGPPRWEAGD